MEKLYNFILEILNKAIKLSLTFLCLGVIIQLLILFIPGDKKNIRTLQKI